MWVMHSQPGEGGILCPLAPETCHLLAPPPPHVWVPSPSLFLWRILPENPRGLHAWQKWILLIE